MTRWASSVAIMKMQGKTTKRNHSAPTGLEEKGLTFQTVGMVLGAI